MRLKKIKLAGFKSFVDPTTIPFPDEMTAIVGPNGCGKSNVIDAVRWVLGESSAKNLRGDAMTDVIFNGSTERNAVSQCSVELVFDNSSGRISGEFAAYNELSVKRNVTKDAVSSYMLNGSKCRRRDVTDLFLGTGLGPRSYAIIEQGMISRLIESKPQELRVFIEEAAGISKYKERRRETENRIRHTKDNLERLEDVRGELGQQLEKLKNQANAARRYKALKQQERQLKGQLAAMSWQAHSRTVQRLEQEIEQKNAELEAYIDQQRGKESSINLDKNQQQELKQTLNEVQQQFFLLGTEITKVEQNQIHTKQRRQQIELELTSLFKAIADSQEHLQLISLQIETIEAQHALSEPEQALLEEQLNAAQAQLEDLEDKRSKQQNHWHHQALQYQQLKQQIQTCHSQVQSTMNMQMRTQQRISELRQEQNEFAQEQQIAELRECEQSVLSLSENTRQGEARLNTAKQLNQDEQNKLSVLEIKKAEYLGLKQSIRAQIDALQAVQLSQQSDSGFEQKLSVQGIESQEWFSKLQVEAGWEAALEIVCANWQHALLIDKDAFDSVNLEPLHGVALITSNDDTSQAKVENNSLASKIQSPIVPSFLHNIILAKDINEAMEYRASISVAQSVVTSDGVWLGRDWMLNHPHDASSGGLLRERQIKQLCDEESKIQLSLQAVLDDISLATERAGNKQQALESAHLSLQQNQQQLVQAQNKKELLAQQLQQHQSRHVKLAQELDGQQEIFEEEASQLETFTLQIEELELKLEDMQTEQEQVDESKRTIELNCINSRDSVERLKEQQHQHALTLQSTVSQLSSLQSNQTREVQQLRQMQQKQHALQNESAELALPLEEQQSGLQALLEQRSSIELQKNELANQLAELEQRLQEAEKGQQGIHDNIQRMQTAIQSLHIECEGYRVREKSVVEQIQEMRQSLDAILEDMPAHANQSEWQQELDKVQAAVSRLGAVNLAAVEEYDVQAQRKQHLDEQNQDLESALETLEQAIRKIDKETRARFKTTFDQVNEGLSNLFPKVFGGGSAYLDLTDDDLLETGVSIMARPPGKKNSTIHLLSGGEKALTALSLVFAIFQLNPAPFCLLDEVDAPLDDANVVRFCKLVSEMSKSVQFIYITHNKIAMEMATHLTGVTMSEPGVSRMVAVDVDEAIAIAQA